MLFEFFGVRDLLLCFLIFTPLEYILPIHEKARKLRTGVVTDLLHFFVSGLPIRFGLTLVIVLATHAGSALVPAVIPSAIQSTPLWLQVIAGTILADLGMYIAHRAMHSVPVLWHFHAVHHSSEELDWLAAYRVHPVDQVLVKGASLVPLFALGFSGAAIAIAALIYHWQSLLIHSNIRLPLGPLRWLVVGPEFHHWHHANQREAYDKNFAGQMPLWDMVFGTLHLPGRMPERYGVDDPVPASYLKQLTYPFRRLFGQRQAEPQANAPLTNRTTAD